MTKGKTLAELDVKPGDVVRLDNGDYIVGEWDDDLMSFKVVGDEYAIFDMENPRCTIVSRANEPTEDKPKTWWGPWELITGPEYLEPRQNMEIAKADDGSPIAYRIRKEPVRETVTLHYGDDPTEATMSEFPSDTHRITFDTIDGKPDCDSIRMEAIGDG